MKKMHHHMTTRSRYVSALLVAGAVLLVAGVAHAAPSDGPLEFNPPEFISSLVNFAIYIGIIVGFGGVAIQRYFKNRRADLTSGIEEAAAMRAEAEKRLSEYTARLDKFESERTALLEEFRDIGEREKTRIIAEANAQADRIREQAERTGEQELRRARRELEAELMERAFNIARDEVRSALTPQVRSRLTEAGVAEIREATTSTAQQEI